MIQVFKRTEKKRWKKFIHLGTCTTITTVTGRKIQGIEMDEQKDNKTIPRDDNNIDRILKFIHKKFMKDLHVT